MEGKREGGRRERRWRAAVFTIVTQETETRGKKSWSGGKINARKWRTRRYRKRERVRGRSEKHVWTER